jgi:hypothetical protein
VSDRPPGAETGSPIELGAPSPKAESSEPVAPDARGHLIDPSTAVEHVGHEHVGQKKHADKGGGKEKEKKRREGKSEGKHPDKPEGKSPKKNAKKGAKKQGKKRDEEKSEKKGAPVTSTVPLAQRDRHDRLSEDLEPEAASGSPFPPDGQSSAAPLPQPAVTLPETNGGPTTPDRTEAPVTGEAPTARVAPREDQPSGTGTLPPATPATPSSAASPLEPTPLSPEPPWTRTPRTGRDASVAEHSRGPVSPLSDQWVRSRSKSGGVDPGSANRSRRARSFTIEQYRSCAE